MDYKLLIFCFFQLILSFSIHSQNSKSVSAAKENYIKKAIGSRLEDAIGKLDIDSSKCLIQVEPLGVARGIKIELADSSILFFFIKRKEFLVDDYAVIKVYFSQIKDEIITGAGIARKNCKKKSWGTGFIWWGLTNPYCKWPDKPKRWLLKQEGVWRN